MLETVKTQSYQSTSACLNNTLKLSHSFAFFIGHPEIFPLLLTAKTQEIFNCRPDEDVTEENCFKCIKKQDIIKDLKTRAKTSDFYPLKKVVLVCSIFHSLFKTYALRVSVLLKNGSALVWLCENTLTL